MTVLNVPGTRSGVCRSERSNVLASLDAQAQCAQATSTITLQLASVIARLWVQAGTITDLQLNAGR